LLQHDHLPSAIHALFTALIQRIEKLEAKVGSMPGRSDDRQRRWVSRNEAAHLAGVSGKTINDWAISGMIPASAMRAVGKTRSRYDANFFEMFKPT
jgi:hypothetical protein